MEVKLNGMRVHFIRFSLHFTDANLYSWVGRVENKVSKNTTDLN